MKHPSVIRIPSVLVPIFVILIGLIGFQSTTQADAGPSEGSPPGSFVRLTPTGEAWGDVDEAAVKALASTSPDALLSGDGLTYRHNWGNRNGQWTLHLNWGSVRRGSRVFVTISECGHMGAARYT
ncbi:MAG: hypothetical protein AB7J34_26155, partial [Limisphaerales bacterium]